MELVQTEQEALNQLPLKNRSWYVNGLGQTMVAIPAGMRFRMGSPKNEQDRDAVNEKAHLRLIGRSFAISAKEVTNEQFGQFAHASKGLQTWQYMGIKGSTHYTYRSPQTSCPAIYAKWYTAVAFCNWLSQQEGIPQDQWCYQPNDSGEYGKGTRIVSAALSRVGYRLAAESEWEYACRAESQTAYAFGQDSQLLGQYAWWTGNYDGRVQPVGTLKPNAFGMFDMNGNAYEWCHHFDRQYIDNESATVEDGTLGTPQELEFVLRGGSCNQFAPECRSAWRLWHPGHGGQYIGFRVARTLRTGE
jgi:hypothetical protein